MFCVIVKVAIDCKVCSNMSPKWQFSSKTSARTLWLCLYTVLFADSAGWTRLRFSYCVIDVLWSTSSSLLMQYLSLECKGLFTLYTRTEFNVHWLCSRCTFTNRFGAMQIECALNQSTSEGGLELNWNQIHCFSSNNDEIAHSYVPTNSSIVKAFMSRPPYMLYSSSKIQTTMTYHAGTLLTRCCWKWDRLLSGLM